MRQRRDLLGNAMPLEYAGDIGLPLSRADQPFVEPVGLAELEPDPVDGVQEILGPGFVPERIEDALFMRCQIGRGPRRKALQERRVTCLRFRHAALALGRRRCRIEAQYLVDQLEVPIVVDQALIGGDFGIDAYPEADVRLERRGMGERIRFVGGGRGREQRREQQQAERRELSGDEEWRTT